MDFDYLLRLGQFLFTVVVGLFSYMSARKASSKVEAEALAQRLAGQDNRLTVLEQQMKHLPTSDQFTELAGAQREVQIHQGDSLSCRLSSAFSCARLVRAQAP